MTHQVRKQAPELIEEWTRLQPSDRPGVLNHLRSYRVNVPEDAGLATIGPLTIKQLNIFSHKAALCLYFQQFKQPLSNEGRVSALWRSKEDFSKDGVPATILEIMPKYGTLIQGKWNSAETFEYRFDLNDKEGLFGCFARFRTGLFVMGFVVRNADMLTVELGTDWIKPNELFLDHPHFLKKN